MPRRPNRPVRNSDGPFLIESFLIAAVVSFLGIRAFLTLTGFPRVGGGELHIAHMLWGGALMLVAIMLLLSFLDRPVQHVSAVIAGLGFGTFVDEIGKFLTTDNDYLFRPAVALIYVIFVVIFLVGRAIAGRRQLTEREALDNALDMIGGTLDEPLEPEDRTRIEAMLERAGSTSPLLPALRHYLDSLPVRPDEQAWWEVLPRRLGAVYERVAGDLRFERVMAGAVILYATLAVAGSLIVVATAGRPDASQPASVSAVGQVASTLVGAALVARGVLALPGSRTEAFRWFLRGILVWLLVTQVFVFYDSQLAGLTGLTIDLAAYSMLRYGLRRETAKIPAASNAIA